MGRREVTAELIAPGHYAASGNALSMAGQWSVEVSVERPAEPSAQSVFQVDVGQPPGANRVAFSPARIVLQALTPSAALGASALLLAGIIFFQRMSWRPGRARRLGTLVGATLVAAGLWATGATLVSAYRARLPNPVPAAAASLERGQATYLANCASCHGAGGRGEGPAGRLLRPRPADLRIHMAERHTDAELYGWVAGGVDGTAMPAFRDTLSEEEIWHVVNYIRTFGPGQRLSP